MPTTQELLPAPFDWCVIPDGKVTLAYYQDPDDGWEDPKSYLEATVPEFAIAKYPITNAQYAKFVEAGGYRNRKWWTNEGWRLLQAGLRWLDGRPELTKKAWTAPLFWQHSQWIGLKYPVVGVSWYEAFAFCQWLSDASAEHITLPTEHQWQRAAQGDDGRLFPWGNVWNARYCNNNVDKQGIGKTTPVQQYEGQGESHFGVVDMSGNVYEWLLNKSSGQRGSTEAEGADDRMMRGGSWLDGATQAFVNDTPHPTNTYFRSDYREAAAASASMNWIGFRIVRI